MTGWRWSSRLASAAFIASAKRASSPPDATVSSGPKAVPTLVATSNRTVSTPNAPAAIGPYSQAVVHNGLAFVSGCIPFDPQTMQCVDGGVEAQAQRALDNLMAVVAAAGSDKSQVLKTTVFLKDMNDFAKVNVRLLDSPQAIYEKAFAPYKPARSAVEVARLPRDVLVEVECIAAARE